LVIAAAVYDVRYRRIPNWLTVLGVVVGLALNAWLRQQAGPIPWWPGLKFGLIGMGVAFGVYFFLYAMHAMGAGDVKLMAAVGAMVGWQDWFAIFLITALIGGVMALILVTARGRVKKTLFNVAYLLNEMKSGRAAYMTREELDVKNPKALGLPHGAVIAVGSLFFLAISAHFVR
jgi:prepilin peptidase CpaA